ncbi:hypothetical protein [Leifsonia shinshuensis]|uniref:hypothetical protein n=1 Tax=Leifsonia shinshuensis TaxID=150026 RepID=UPI002156170C|nr:hypothetical protein [Leifsonia shinshuensis]
MMLPPTPRVLALREIVAEVRALAPGGRVVVAVDGGGGTSGFADELAVVFRESGVDTHRASVGDFHRPRADRTFFGPETPERYYRDAFDYSTLQRVLLDPFRMGGSTGFQTRPSTRCGTRRSARGGRRPDPTRCWSSTASSCCGRSCGGTGTRRSCS